MSARARSVMERWQLAIARGERFEMEFPLRRHDGAMRWFRTRVSPVRDGSGNVVRWVGVNTEIHQPKVALEQLDDTLESMSDASFLLDSEWRVLRVNRHQEAVSQVPRELSLGRSLRTVRGPNAAAAQRLSSTCSQAG